MDIIDNEVSSCLGEGKVFPPGFRFHPTDEELVLYYLKRKMCRRRHRLDVIGETDVYKWKPEELPGISKLRTGDRQWFFFSPRDRKYPTGARSNRATRHGYWKATGKDRIIPCNSRNVGVKKTLVFYKGRAPNGERTDWVMHEYTMTEEELKSCQSVKDNYALYKVFKKSGPGPKNGEQYGAPFMEEDWSDGLDANDLVGQVNNVTHVEITIPVSDNRVNGQLQSHGDGYEEFMNSIACEPISVQPLAVDYGVSFAELLGEEEEAQNVFVGEASRGITLPVQRLVLQPAMQLYNGQASFDITQLGTSHLQLHESPKVKSAAKSHIPQQSIIVEGDIEDFLEMDDLLGPEFTGEHTDRPTQVLEDVHFDEFFDGLGEFDLYQDLPEFLSEGEAGGQGLISQQNTNNLGNGVANPVSNFSNNNFVGETANLQQAYLCNGNDSNIVRWSHDQRRIVHTPGQASQGTVPIATPGVVYDSNSVKHQTGASKNNSWKQDDGTDSWFSSSIWAFVESIPTTPASAAESALVNHTFERISSFSRLRTNSRSVDVAAGSTCTTSISSSKRDNGLFFFSLFGILCAILWMFMRTSR